MAKTILVVEDDKSVARMLEDVLVSEGFSVLVERDGEAGLQTIRSKPIDLLILDVLVPKLKGFELIARLREAPSTKGLPVIVVSGVYRSAMHKERITAKHGIVEYLDKPLDIDQLIDVLHDVFSSAYPTPLAKPPALRPEQKTPSNVAPPPRRSTVRPEIAKAAAEKLAAAKAAVAARAQSMAPSAPSKPASSPTNVAAPKPSSSPSNVAPKPSSSPAVAASPSTPQSSSSGTKWRVPSTAALAASSSAKASTVPAARTPSLAPVEGTPPTVNDRGELDEVPFARLFGTLFAARATGSLLLRKGTVKKIVYLRKGVPVFVKSNLLDECLGRIMVAERLITAEQCERSLQKKKVDNKKQGEVLVAMGCISPSNLEFALELQMQTKLYELFSWLEGRYQFVAKDDYTGPVVSLTSSPASLIFEGASRTMSTDRIERELERIDNLIVAPPRDPSFRAQALELDPRSGSLVDRIDGRRTVRQLLDRADYDRDEAALLVYALTSAGLLTVVGAPRRLESKKAALPKQPEPMVIDDADVVALETAEINVISAMGRLGQEPIPPRIAAKIAAPSADVAPAPPPSADVAARLGALPKLGEAASPPLAASETGKERLVEALFGDLTGTSRGSQRLDEHAFEAPREDAASDPSAASNPPVAGDPSAAATLREGEASPITVRAPEPVVLEREAVVERELAASADLPALGATAIEPPKLEAAPEVPPQAPAEIAVAKAPVEPEAASTATDGAALQSAGSSAEAASSGADEVKTAAVVDLAAALAGASAARVDAGARDDERSSASSVAELPAIGMMLPENMRASADDDDDDEEPLETPEPVTDESDVPAPVPSAPRTNPFASLMASSGVDVAARSRPSSEPEPPAAREPELPKPVLPPRDAARASLKIDASPSASATLPRPSTVLPRVPTGETPQLSDELRRQVRARLEAEASKLAAERAGAERPSTARAPITSVAPAAKKAPLRARDVGSRLLPREDERDHARVKKELTLELERIEQQTAYEILGVSRRATADELRAAYEALARDRHPDKVVAGTTSRENRALAESVFLAIGRAYATLADDDTRAAYDRRLANGAADDRIAPLLLAERAFSRGEIARRAGDLDAAHEAFKEAVELNPNDGVYWAHLGFTAFTRQPDDGAVREQVLAQLDRAAALSPDALDVWIFRGTVHQKAGHRAEAVRDFEAAVRLDPDALPALQALRTLEPPAPKKTGLLSRLSLGGGDRNS